jgi:trimeric autotransporter adhesin
MPLWSYAHPPVYHPTAVASPGGWKDPVTNELLVAISNFTAKNADAIIVPTYTLAVPANGTYVDGNVLTVTVASTEPLFVEGTPSIALTIGAKNAQLVYNPADSTPTALKFEYTVVSGDSAPSGIVVANIISLTTVGKGKNAITDQIVGGGGEAIAPAALTFTVPATTGILVSGA